jgi:hypothetical protein
MKHRVPAFWLVLELDGELKAVDPTRLPTGERDVDFLVGVARGYHEVHPGRRLVFMSDLNQWLALVGLHWGRLDVDLSDLSDQLGLAIGGPPTLNHRERFDHSTDSVRR